MVNVIGIGELLWDKLPEGKKLGGAPCNFVYHALQQGANGMVLSAVGDDELGQEIIEALKRKSLSTKMIQVNDKPTGTVDVKLNADGVPEYLIHEHVAWDFIGFNKTEAELPVVSELLKLSSTDVETKIIELIKRYHLQLVAYTSGPEDSLLITPAEKSKLPSPKVEVKDTVGAGDAFTATMMVGFAEGQTLKELHQKAVEISAFVCTSEGAMPDYK